MLHPPVVYSSILDSDHFAIELALTAANQNNAIIYGS